MHSNVPKNEHTAACSAVHVVLVVYNIHYGFGVLTRNIGVPYIDVLSKENM